MATTTYTTTCPETGNAVLHTWKGDENHAIALAVAALAALPPAEGFIARDELVLLGAALDDGWRFEDIYEEWALQISL